MGEKHRRFWRDSSIQTKMLVIILPLIVLPMLILAAVGFVTSSREAAKTSTRCCSLLSSKHNVMDRRRTPRKTVFRAQGGSLPWRARSRSRCQGAPSRSW